MIFNPPDLDLEDIRRLAGSIIIPRPIFLISTSGPEGRFNVAPFSQVTQVCYKPFLLGVSILRRNDGSRKDTLRNMEDNHEFVASLVQESFMDKMNIASRNYSPDIDEFKESGLTPLKADIVQAPLVAESPVNMECRLVQVLEFGSSKRLSNFVIAEVLRIHVKDEVCIDNSVPMRIFGAMGNVGNDYYCRTADHYKIVRQHNPPHPGN